MTRMQPIMDTSIPMFMDMDMDTSIPMNMDTSIPMFMETDTDTSIPMLMSTDTSRRIGPVTVLAPRLCRGVRLVPSGWSRRFWARTAALPTRTGSG